MISTHAMVFANSGLIANSTILWDITCMVLEHLLSKYRLVTGTMRERHHKALHKKKAFAKKFFFNFLDRKKKKEKKMKKENEKRGNSFATEVP